MNNRKAKKKIVRWLEQNGPAYEDQITEGVYKHEACKECGHISSYNTKESQIRNILHELMGEGKVGVGANWMWGVKK